MAEPFDLADAVVHIGLGSKLTPFLDWSWDEETLTRYSEATAGDGAEGRMVVMNDQAESWPNWERHPAGDELVLLLEGRVDLIQEIDGDEVRTSLRGGHAVVNPPGENKTTVVTPAEKHDTTIVTPGSSTEKKTETNTTITPGGTSVEKKETTEKK